MHALSVHNLVKVYGNGVQALRGIDLEVEAGDFFALLGPNGAGKTTAIGIVTSLINKTSGEVRVFGHSIDDDLNAAKICLAVVPQELNLNSFDRVFNIVVNQAGFYGIPLKQARKRGREVLEQLQLWDRRDDVARDLSGGMKRRLMIARALISSPRLLILDEPTAGVDIEIRRSMWQFLRDINAAGTTIILTTHYLEEAENLCRHVAIIDDGRIIQNHPMADFLRTLHQEVILLNTRDPITEIPKLAGFQVSKRNEHELEVEIPRDRDLNQLFASLGDAGIHITSMRNRMSRLEELFFAVTDNKSGADSGGQA